jgi:hypothetical protein
MQYLKLSSKNVQWRQLYETRFRTNVEWPSDVLLKLKNTQKSSFIVLMMLVVKIKQRNRVSCGSYLWTHSTVRKCGHLHHIIWNQNYSRLPRSDNPVQVQLEVVLWPKGAKHKHLRLQAQTQNICFNADCACGRGIWATKRNGQGYSRCQIYLLLQLSSLQSVLLHLLPYKKKL